MPYIVSKKESIQYDGTNADFILNTWLTGVTLESTTPDGTLKVWLNESDFEFVPVGYYIIRTNGVHWSGLASPDQYAAGYVELPQA